MAGDHWISENDLATLTRLLEGQRVVDGRAEPLNPPVSVHRLELFIGIDSDGKRFLTRNPARPVDSKVLAPSVGSASTTVRAPVAVTHSAEIAAHRLRGSLLAGAVGDALGAPIESDSIDRIRERTGPHGLTDFVPAYEGLGTITDDTQMTLATADAIIRAHAGLRRGAQVDTHYELQLGYQRWLHTQGVPWERARGPHEHSERPDGWLMTHRDLFHRRAPGATCFFALKGFAQTGEMATFTRTINNSKGCGGVMRAAPIALWSDDPAAVFALAAASGALTHSHPSGYLSAGAFAVIIQQLLREVPLLAAIDVAKAQLANWNGHEEQTVALDQAIRLAQQGPPTPEKIATLGGGNVGETALAIGVYATLVTNTLDEALLVAVNHSGDSDSTGSVAGNLAGAVHGEQALRASWLDRLELRDVIAQVADDLRAEFGPNPPGGDWFQRYPAAAA
ncbi:ADP-ribosylglycohydrolase family protein [Amycolatopsis sp. NPDC059657]|uniref:ADP-ribosylglycohydrolase family protein n=1 Tax=Amycolatopsis sp. NPDC059657 TaxID=3346899 RepID=UPI00366B19E2